ncbi:MAG: AraC family transcriptional regulator [Bacteroidaceae bacterium]|nr:AraC family transcriptional regulator [Bacteroidaceae bacterium]
MMKHHVGAYIGMVVAAMLTIAGCTGKGKDTGNSREPQASDTLYTWRAAMQVYGYQPERALQIIDSAVIVGNMSEVQAEVNRARVYSLTQVNEQMDSLLGGQKGAGLEKGRAIGEQLLKHDSLKTNLKLKQEVLDILVYTARQQQDTVRWLQRSRELVDVYHQMGPEKETDALRTEAEIGAALYFAGQQQQGLAKLDSVINLLNESPSFKFNELDALILASKRKIFVLIAQGKEVETLPLARRIIERLDDYEQHPDDYNDNSLRVLKDSTSRAGYINYYRNQAQGYITAAYASLGELGNMSEAYKQIENSFTEATAREHIARYNALQQKMETERQKAITYRANIAVAAFGFFALIVIVFAIVLFRQNRIIKRKNSVLAHEIAEAIKLREEVKVISENSPFPSPSGEMAGDFNLDSLNNDELFQYIREVVVRDELFLDPTLNRQMLTERFSLSKERVGAAFAQGSPFKSVTEFVNDCRLLYAAKLLTENPSLSITEVAEASGFSRAATFIDNFKKRFTLTPTQYRTQNLA